jgi:hypothetical protein
VSWGIPPPIYTAHTFTIRTSVPGSNAVFFIKGKSVFVNKKGLIWLLRLGPNKGKSAGAQHDTKLKRWRT